MQGPTGLKKVTSIRYSSPRPAQPALPDFRSAGLLLRVALSVNGLALLAVLLGERPGGWGQACSEMAARVEPPLIFALGLLWLAQPWLAGMPAALALSGVTLLCASCGLASNLLLIPLGQSWSWWPGLWAALVALGLLHYLDLRSRALSPALAEARLLALTARIRPHFLFNSLNGVLGILRSEPRRAETALEELADLYRALMKDNQELVPLGEEIGLCRQYLNLERLRLGERLQVRWDMASCPPDALVPPLMLQPLLENAVRHGIEPGGAPGEIQIAFDRQGAEIRIEISNPWHGEGESGAGNRMALDNVRQRLLLFFDMEARLENAVEAGRYRVRIRLPYRGQG